MSVRSVDSGADGPFMKSACSRTNWKLICGTLSAVKITGNTFLMLAWLNCSTFHAFTGALYSFSTSSAKHSCSTLLADRLWVFMRKRDNFCTEKCKKKIYSTSCIPHKHASIHRTKGRLSHLVTLFWMQSKLRNVLDWQVFLRWQSLHPRLEPDSPRVLSQCQ